MEQQWSSTAKSILWAIVTQIVATFLMGVFAGLAAVGAAAAIMSGDSDVSMFAIFTGGGMGILALIFALVAIGAYVWYFLQISKFVTLQTNKPDADAIAMVRNAVIVSFVGMICSFIPVIGWVISALLNIAAAIMIFLGFNSFSKSAVLPQAGKVGAGQLKVYAILAIVGSVLAIIPLVGSILGGLCGLVGLIFLIMGWNNVSKGCPAPRAAGEPYV